MFLTRSFWNLDLRTKFNFTGLAVQTCVLTLLQFSSSSVIIGNVFKNLWDVGFNEENYFHLIMSTDDLILDHLINIPDFEDFQNVAVAIGVNICIFKNQ